MLVSTYIPRDDNHRYVTRCDALEPSFPIVSIYNQWSILLTHQLSSGSSLDQRLLANYRIPQQNTHCYPEYPVDQLSDIQYHAPSNQMLFTCRRSGINQNILWAFSPNVAEATEHGDREPLWTLPSSELGFYASPRHVSP